MKHCLADHEEYQHDCVYCVLQKIALLERKLSGMNVTDSKFNRSLAIVMLKEIQDLKLRVGELTSRRAQAIRNSA